MISSLRSCFLVLAAVLSLAAWAAPPANFAGTWVFNAKKSTNIGMMAGLADTVTVEQTAAELTLRDVAVFNGNRETHETRFELSGKSVANQSPTGDPAHTASHWAGSRLITIWETAGSIAGSTHRRTETRYLSSDGGTMFVESSGAKPLIMVFDKQ